MTVLSSRGKPAGGPSPKAIRKGTSVLGPLSGGRNTGPRTASSSGSTHRGATAKSPGVCEGGFVSYGMDGGEVPTGADPRGLTGGPSTGVRGY